MKRIFLAIDAALSEACQCRIQQLKTELRDERIRWVKPRNYHLTLHFFGMMAPDDEARLVGLLGDFAATRHALTVELGHLSFFKKAKQPQVLFVDVEQVGELKALVADMQHRLVEAGFIEAPKSFRPHLTIARMKKIENMAQLLSAVSEMGDLPRQQLHVDRMVLYESIQTAQGAEYRAIQSFPLS
ncbi:RNA 2',3'-cyclic phosphodiesterase [Mangrovibacterium marinum]|uniref:RNA 2',3'-cyclic phosphodiesterase n=1 Tax=Mangrovibacterium marinum TaxID=1639118 RepID=A0A2T5C172_9BACT|nr:RNA 2',3'-cyclic phosphodiesterase [Mangrovibacterium marinum]PTN08386.1 2'-5' RNA ligase [Mangrovibacterium marinum]